MEPRRQTANRLAARLLETGARPEFRREIEACPCANELKAGLFLLNGDWTLAHEAAQSLDNPVGAHWHALVHREEPDYTNTKYWLRRSGGSPIFPALVRAAQAVGTAHLVSPGGVWDPIRFTDCFAQPEHDGWTRPLHRLEMETLLQHCLERFA